MPDSVVIFIDYQNVYRRARELFCVHDIDPHWMGQISPGTLGDLLVNRSPFPRELKQVRVYRGLPSSEKDPHSYSAARTQISSWEDDPRVKTINRPLRYPWGWPDNSAVGEKPGEKGIDVSLAIDYAAMAVQKEFDVGILFSVDTDLKPALEFVAQDNIPGRTEVAAWRNPESDQHQRRLSIKGRRIFCHWLDEDDFQEIRDDTNYAPSRY